MPEAPERLHRRAGWISFTIKRTRMELRFTNYNDAIQAALDWLRARNVPLDEVFEAKMGGFGMRSLDRSGGYRIEFDAPHRAHINVWAHAEKGPHYTFPGNERSVRTLWRQLFFWDPAVKYRSRRDQNL